MIHALSTELFGQSLTIPAFPEKPEILGLGMTDWEGYAVPLAKKLGYTNTYYHQEPKLDITAISSHIERKFDFILSSDVFEHVPPPISLAFENIRRLLKPSGVLIFTVPYTKDPTTREHFPDLCDYQISEVDGRYLLHNKTRDGVVQVFEDLIFHGGPGATLEMRLFSESSLVEEFRRAGFSNPKVYRSPDFRHGVYWEGDSSLPMSVRPR